jgi:chemotaxis signal transduction protein
MVMDGANSLRGEPGEQRVAPAARIPATPAGPSASPPVAAARPDGTGAGFDEYLALVLGGTMCAVPLSAVREVLPGTLPVVPLPDSPPWLHGVFHWRGDLIPLIDPLPMLTGDPSRFCQPHRPARHVPSGHSAWTTPGGAAIGVHGGDGSIVVLEDDTPLVALTVDALGPLGAFRSDAGSAEGAICPILVRYIATRIADSLMAPAGDAACPILRVGTLLADLVAALAEEGESPNA